MAQNKDKKQVVYIHGGQAFSKYDDFLTYLKTAEIRNPFEKAPKRWRDTLAEDLGAEYEVLAPSMPNKQNAKYLEWKMWFERHLPFLRDGVILVGHSQGGYFLAKYLTENQMPVSVRALYLVAAPAGPDDFGGEDGGDFLFDISKLRDGFSSVGEVFVFHSKDDRVVPYTHAGRYKELFPGASLVSFEDKGHFLIERFPEFLEHIRRLT